ncbi:MAG: YceD family protein [Roseburia sp.]
MKLDISDILSCENKEVTREVPIETESFVSRLGEFPITRKTPVVLTITNRENKHLLVNGEGDVQVSIPCSRCLEEVLTDIHFVIDKKIPLAGTEADEEEMEDSDYLIGFHLDVDRLIYGEILVNWPMKVLCNEDCKGICKVCGMNLNKGECGCQRTELDPRMAAIQDVFNKFKEV